MSFDDARTLRNQLENMLGEKYFFRMHETHGKYWIAISDGTACIATFNNRNEFEKLVEFSRNLADYYNAF